MATIAIIEDDKDISEMYRIKFEADGYKVFTAANGKAGIALIHEQKPDIILTDLMMPVMTGDEMLREIRKTDWGKNIKAIVLSNISIDEANVLLQDLQIEGHIVKAHYTPQEVVDLVKHILEKQND